MLLNFFWNPFIRFIIILFAGPLLYHFADLPNEKSIEPSYEIIREVIHNIGFIMLVCRVLHKYNLYYVHIVIQLIF